LGLAHLGQVRRLAFDVKANTTKAISVTLKAAAPIPVPK
jgi:hypothetical protein